MSKSRLDKLLKTSFVSKKEKERLQKEADKATKKEKAIASGVQQVAGTGIAVASGVAAVTAAGASASAGTFLTAAAVAAPPFSTAAAVVAGIGLAVGLGIKGAGEQRKKFLSKDEGLLNKLISDYKKKKSSWRKKEISKILKDYDKHLDKGNKKTLSLFDGNKRNKEEIGWRAKKAEYEMKLRALYAAQYSDSYNKSMKEVSKPKISKKQAKAEQIVVKRIKDKQRNSIDPRTSMLKLWRPGQVIATPKMLAADAMQLRKPDTSIIKLAKMAEENPALYQNAGKLSAQINESNRQAVALAKTPTDQLPKPIQEALKKQEKDLSEDTKKPILIGSAIGASALVLWASFLIGSKKSDNG